MKLTTTTILLAAGAILLIWSGITDRNPLQVLKAIFTGEPIPEKGSWGGNGGTRGASGESGEEGVTV